MSNCVDSFAEQLVLYLKTTELLSSALHTAMDRVKQGKLYPSATVKQSTNHLLKVLLLVGLKSLKSTLFLCSFEETEWALQVECGLLSLAQHSPGALLQPEAPPDGPDHLHHGRAAALQPHRADGGSERVEDEQRVKYHLWSHRNVPNVNSGSSRRAGWDVPPGGGVDPALPQSAAADGGPLPAAHRAGGHPEC